jgi:hypothetical protein
MPNPELPVLDDRDVIQVVMTEAFYRAHFAPLMRAQDFTLFRIPTEDSDELPTYGIGLGASRAGMLRDITPP